MGHRAGGPEQGVPGPVSALFWPSIGCACSRAGCSIGRGIGHIEEDDDLPAWLALESATMFSHGLFETFIGGVSAGPNARALPRRGICISGDVGRPA